MHLTEMLAIFSPLSLSNLAVAAVGFRRSVRTSGNGRLGPMVRSGLINLIRGVPHGPLSSPSGHCRRFDREWLLAGYRRADM